MVSIFCEVAVSFFASFLTSACARGESNAVVYSNSVLGARTEKYADYFDILAAIVGWGEHKYILFTVHSQLILHATNQVRCISP